MQPVYQRVILKLSGEALAGESPFGIDHQVLEKLAKDIKTIISLPVQVGVVIGGGNFFRGKALSEGGIDRVTADHMGMLATLMNALAMREVFERQGLSSRIMSAIPMSGIVDHYDRRKAIHHLESGRVVIFAAGTGTPLVTTDSAASLRGIEIEADILLKATQVDGIFSEDPRINPQAKRYTKVTYQEVLKKELAIMDLAAFCQCRDHQLKMQVFNIQKPDALLRVICGEDEGTVVE